MLTLPRNQMVGLQDHWLALPLSILAMPSFHSPFVFSWVPGLGCGLQANVSVSEALGGLGGRWGRHSKGQTCIDGNTLKWVRVYESFWCFPPELCYRKTDTPGCSVGGPAGSAQLEV